MKWTVQEIAEAAGAKIGGGNPKQIVERISTDTRKIREGDLYVALKGPNFNGHDFIADALAKGACGAVVSQDVKVPAHAVQIRVGDTLSALGDIAHGWRMKFTLPVVGITGSSGKTSTKEMLSACLAVAGPVDKTEGNLNNLIGLPLTVFNLDSHHRFAVWEMGMNMLGEIARLTEIARPTIGLITNVGHAHLEGLGSVAGVAKAKSELFSGLEEGSLAVVNADDPYVVAMTTKAERFLFGFSPTAHVRCEKMEFLPDSMRLTVRDPDRVTVFKIPFVGEHHARNWLAAYSVCYRLGLSPEQAQKGIEGLKPAKMRGEVLNLANGVTVVNDAYNANPDSMAASLKSLNPRFPGRRKVAVLGEMLELGERTAELHKEVGRAAREAGVEVLLSYGEHGDKMVEGFTEAGGRQGEAFSDMALLSHRLPSILKNGDVLLVKGSRGSRMEQVVEFLSTQAK